MPGYDEFEDDQDDEFDGRGPDEPWMRDRCVIPGSCIVADPYHGPEECHTAEDVEAYEAEFAGPDIEPPPGWESRVDYRVREEAARETQQRLLLGVVGFAYEVAIDEVRAEYRAELELGAGPLIDLGGEA